MAESLLPVVDTFRLGLGAADQHPEAKVVADGFRMVWSQFGEVLRGMGIEEIVPTGAVFDPTFHECVAHLPHAEVADNHVIDTVRIGYKLGDRLIRPATVVVSRGSVDASSAG
jgi:molecular chaperone GrpE